MENQEKHDLFNKLKKLIEPVSAINLESMVSNIDDRLLLTIGLLLYYGETFANCDFLNDLEWKVSLS
ncbi:hypothetical protein [Vagococcus fluvialis]|uniref:hypothetical protein n=1 Tax=Vagococcus fluvialis TaxID=2738 RepID=UPI003D0D5B4D